MSERIPGQSAFFAGAEPSVSRRARGPPLGIVVASAVRARRRARACVSCKQAVIPLLDELAEEAQAIGAVNTVVRRGDRLVGHNTDGAGWSWGFRRALPAADLSRAVLIGAGGAGSACADAVLRLGATHLVIVDKDVPRAMALAARLNAHFDDGRASASADLRAALHRASGLIHATPTGTPNTPGLPLPAELLRHTMWVSDIVHVPLETALLNHDRPGGWPRDPRPPVLTARCSPSSGGCSWPSGWAVSCSGSGGSGCTSSGAS